MLKKLYTNMEDYVSMFLFAIMCISIFAQLVGRIVFNDPPFFTEEVSRYAYIWLVFFGISLGERERLHFSAEVLPEAAKRAVALLLDVVIIALLLFLFYTSLDFWQFSKVIKTPALELPSTIVSTCLCVGFGLAAIRRIELLVSKFRHKGASV